MDNLTKEFGSWVGTEPRIIAEKQREKDIFNSVAGKKIKIQFTQQRDWSSSKGEAIGKIIPKDECNCDRCITSSGQIHWQVCGACECRITSSGCGCNHPDS
ncbi:MAG: hypothetical protein U1D31_03410 [Patescibacteria group bacterium]|nr:hypothetical protein [Patescibacteria group bacterium]